MTILGRTFTDADARRVIWTAVQAGTVAFPVLLAGLKTNTKAALLTFVIAVGAAAGSALKNWFLADSSSVK
jgi:uncharacterized membrane protein YphA (DoxX/SURF4 family)